MKKKYYKTNTFLISILFVLYGFIPACSLIASLLGYDLVLINHRIWAITTLTAGALITVGMFVFTGKKVCRGGGVIASILILVAEANWVTYGFINPDSMVIIALTMVFAYMIWIRFAWPMLLKVPCVIISIIALPLLTFFSVFSYIYASNTSDVVKSVTAPDGMHYADVVVINIADDSSLDVRFDVYEKNADIDWKIVEFKKKPETICEMKYDASEEIQSEVMWIDESTLKINGIEYNLR